MSKELEAAAEEYAAQRAMRGGALYDKTARDFYAGAAYQAKKAQGLVDALEYYSHFTETVMACDETGRAYSFHERGMKAKEALAAYEEWRAAPPDMKEPKKFELGSTITEKDLKP